MRRVLVSILCLGLLLMAGIFAGQFFYTYSQPVVPITFHQALVPDPSSLIPVPPSPIKGIIINHHLLAGTLIDEAFEKVKTDEPIKVILLSPNHFGEGVRAIQTSTSTLKTPKGDFLVDLEITGRLTASKQVSDESNSFQMEHGVYNILPYIKKYLPNATIVPVIAKDGTSDEKIDALAETIHNAVPGALIVASLDFSHYLTSTAAQFHDQKSLQVIREFDFGSIKNVEIDSKPTLRLALKLMDLDGAKNFTLLQDTNSALYTNTPNIAETTSYITGYFERSTEPSTQDPSAKGLRMTANTTNDSLQTTNLLFFGDLMLDRHIRIVINDKGFDYLFEPMARLFDGTDLNVANLEGCFTDSPSEATEDVPNTAGTPDPNLTRNLSFTFDPKSISNLKSYNFNLLSLANNHTANFGRTGLSECRDYLKAGGVEYFGDPFNKDQISVVREIRGKKIAFIGYHQFYKTDESAKSVVDEISRIRSGVDYIIIYPHWGTEYNEGFNAEQQKLAHEFVDAGADLIIGSHPHVIEPAELYKGKMIFYSSGNFVFDQTWNDEVKRGLAVGLTLSDDSLKIYLMPMEMRDWQLHLLESKDSNVVLSKMAEGSEVPEEIKQSIKKGIINISIK